MSIQLYINGKKVNFSFGFGWYRGEEFALLNVTLFETDGDTTLNIIILKIAKLSLDISVNWEK